MVGCMDELVGGWDPQSYELFSSVVCAEARILILDLAKGKQKHALIHEMGMSKVLVKLQHKQTTNNNHMEVAAYTGTKQSLELTHYWNGLE